MSPAEEDQHKNIRGDSCQCHLQLDPFPKGSSSSWRRNGSDSALDHYCHVCNTQLNSCKQTRIHVNGKRHEKRLIYLKYSLECETSESTAESSSQSPSVEVTVPSYYHYESPPYVLPSYEPSGSYYYSPPPAIVQQSGYYDYHASIPPPVLLSSPQSIVTLTAATASTTGGQHVPPPGSYTLSSPPSHGVMSPSLTSGFSGSGADCKSTETSSILSAGSLCSSSNHSPNKSVGPKASSPNTPNNPKKPSCSSSSSSSSSSTSSPSGGSRSPPKKKMIKKKKSSSSSSCAAAKKLAAAAAAEEAATESLLKTLHKLVGKGLTCEVCQISFPSTTVLDNHLKGSRHNRKVKSRQVLHELVDAGAEFRQQSEEEICCEVCSVSVNSSHQLQAHLAGQRHKTRCYRRGVHPSKGILSDFKPSPSGGRSKEKSQVRTNNKNRRENAPASTVVACPASSSRHDECPPLRLSLLGHPGCSVKTDVSTSLMGAPPLPSAPSTTINLSVSTRQPSTSSNNPKKSSSSSSRQKNSQKYQLGHEEKRVLPAGSEAGQRSATERVVPTEPSLVSEEPIPIPSSSSSSSSSSTPTEPEKSKNSTSANSPSSSPSALPSTLPENNNMILPFKCESCKVALAASPTAPTPVS